MYVEAEGDTLVESSQRFPGTVYISRLLRLHVRICVINCSLDNTISDCLHHLIIITGGYLNNITGAERAY